MKPEKRYEPTNQMKRYQNHLDGILHSPAKILKLQHNMKKETTTEVLHIIKKEMALKEKEA